MWLATRCSVPTATAISELHKAVVNEVCSALSEFCEARNSLVAANSLPAEVLTLALSYAPNYYDVVNCACVCRQWRRVALSSRSLWEYVPIRFGRSSSGMWTGALEAALARAGSALSFLRVFFSASSTENTRVVSLITPTFDNLAHLWLQAKYPDGDANTWALLKLPAPRLETFSFGSETTALVRLPENLFAGQAPKLWCIWLVNALLPFDVGGNNTFDSVTEVAYHDIHIMETAEIARTVRLCPALEALAVVADLWDLEDTPPDFVPPRLKAICLKIFLPRGIMHQIVDFNMRRDEGGRGGTGGCDLHLLDEDGMYSALPFAQVDPIGHLHMTFEPARERGFSKQSVTLFARSVGATPDDTTGTGVEFAPVFSALDALASACMAARLRKVRTLTIADALLAMALRGHILSEHDVPSLETLTIHLAAWAIAPLAQLFCFDDYCEADGEDDSADGLALFDPPNLRTVRLTAREAKDGFHREDVVELPAQAVAAWLPSGVTELRLCGVRLVDEPPLDECEDDELELVDVLDRLVQADGSQWKPSRPSVWPKWALEAPPPPPSPEPADIALPPSPLFTASSRAASEAGDAPPQPDTQGAEDGSSESDSSDGDAGPDAASDGGDIEQRGSGWFTCAEGCECGRPGAWLEEMSDDDGDEIEDESEVGVIGLGLQLDTTATGSSDDVDISPNVDESDLGQLFDPFKSTCTDITHVVPITSPNTTMPFVPPSPMPPKPELAASPTSDVAGPVAGSSSLPALSSPQTTSDRASQSSPTLTTDAPFLCVDPEADIEQGFEHESMCNGLTVKVDTTDSVTEGSSSSFVTAQELPNSPVRPNSAPGLFPDLGPRWLERPRTQVISTATGNTVERDNGKPLAACELHLRPNGIFKADEATQPVSSSVCATSPTLSRPRASATLVATSELSPPTSDALQLRGIEQLATSSRITLDDLPFPESPSSARPSEPHPPIESGSIGAVVPSLTSSSDEPAADEPPARSRPPSPDSPVVPTDPIFVPLPITPPPHLIALPQSPVRRRRRRLPPRTNVSKVTVVVEPGPPANERDKFFEFDIRWWLSSDAFDGLSV